MDARVYRQGQKNKVFIYTIAVKESIDMAVIEALQVKGRGQEGFMNALKMYALRKGER